MPVNDPSLGAWPIAVLPHEEILRRFLEECGRDWAHEVYGEFLTDRAMWAFACWLEARGYASPMACAMLRLKIAGQWHASEPWPGKGE